MAYIYIWRRLVCCWARIVSHPRAPCVRERALEWKVAVPSASVRDSIGSRLGLAPGTPGFGDVRGPGLYVINKYENVLVLYTARKMLSSCQLTLVQKTQFYEINWVLCKDKTNHACFLYRLFRNLPATICEGTKKHAFHRRGAQVFFGLGKRRPILATFSGERILRHRGISAKSWSRPAPSMAAAGPRQSQCKGAAAGLYAASVNTFGMAWKRKNMAFIAKTCAFYIQRERCRAAARRHIDKKCNFTG